MKPSQSLTSRASLGALLITCAFGCSGQVGVDPTSESNPNSPGPGSGNGNGAVPDLGTNPNLPSQPGTVGTGGGQDSGGAATPDSTGAGATPGGAGAVPGAGGGASPPGGSLGEVDSLPFPLKGEPLHSRLIRLTHSQWENSVRYLLALNGPTGHLGDLDADAKDGTFFNNERSLYVAASLRDDYERAAEDLAEQVTSDPQQLSRIYSGSDANEFIDTFGRRVYRRPLTQDEAASYLELFEIGTAMSGTNSEFAKGARLVIQTMLQSPHFLYRAELGQVGQPLDTYELAAKLSLTLLGVTPDDDLLNAAGAGQLDSPDGLAQYAAQLLERPEVYSTVREFHSEMLRFNRFSNIVKAQAIVPDYSPEINADLEEASLLFFERIFRESLGLRDILTSTVGYVSTRMARYYGINVSGDGFQEVDLGAQRPGFYAQLPFLILNSINVDPDSIHRGVSINESVLCQEIPPPPTVEALPPLSEGQTNRQRIETLTSPDGCAACHERLINPLGFAFEHYDGLGQWRETDRGLPVDAAATYPFAEGAQSFQGVESLMTIISNGAQAHACYAKHLTEYVLQRDLAATDAALVEQLQNLSRGSDSSVKELLVELVKSPAFRTRLGE